MIGLDMKPRVCAVCQKPFETQSYRYDQSGASKRDYFHSGCFRKFKAMLS